MWSLVYLVARTLVRRLVIAGPAGRADGSKDLEILVLRHQLRVLQRTSGPLKLRAIDRVFLAAASRVMPRDCWVAFLVTPATLLRWHRELVRRARMRSITEDISRFAATSRSTSRPWRAPAPPSVPAITACLRRSSRGPSGRSPIPPAPRRPGPPTPRWERARTSQ